MAQQANPKVTAVPAAAIGKGLSEQAFLGMLISKGLTQKQFVDLVSDAKDGQNVEDCGRAFE